MENKTGKREDYISKEELFMNMARLIAKRSKDPNSQVGCVIVSKNDRILSLGYNGFPNGCSDDEFPWIREDYENQFLNTKYAYVVHAELNAILNFRGPSLEDSILYVSLFPCNECCKAIIQSGIKKVVYGNNKYKDTDSIKASVRMFEAAGVELVEYDDREKRLNRFKSLIDILDNDNINNNASDFCLGIIMDNIQENGNVLLF